MLLGGQSLRPRLSQDKDGSLLVKAAVSKVEAALALGVGTYVMRRES
jgi:hypothetical protein